MRISDEIPGGKIRVLKRKEYYWASDSFIKLSSWLFMLLFKIKFFLFNREISDKNK